VPEGDTVHLAAARLRDALEGELLTRTDFRVPQHATADLSGNYLDEIVARGKHMLFRIDDGTTLHTHFKMEGSWHIYPIGERWTGGPEHQIRVVLGTDDRYAVGYRMGIVELIPTEKEGDVVGHLGPDPLGPDWDAAEAVRRIKERADDAVGSVVLDQSVIAGPGNIYRSEVCFLRGLHPLTPVGRVVDVDGLVDLLARLMHANRTTGMQITTGDTRRGRMQWVYGRAGQPCRRCSTPIETTEQAGPGGPRVVFWCPSCQPAVTTPG
jgi:endonuclease-8